MGADPSPPHSFGEQALLSPSSRRTATASAIEAVETLVLRYESFEALRRRSGGVDRVLVTSLADQVVRLSALVLDALYVPADRRVLRRLAELTDAFARTAADGGPVEVVMTQEELSTMAGTTRPTTNRVLRAAVDQGFLALRRGRLVVLDRTRLAAAAR